MVRWLLAAILFTGAFIIGVACGEYTERSGPELDPSRGINRIVATHTLAQDSTLYVVGRGRGLYCYVVITRAGDAVISCP